MNNDIGLAGQVVLGAMIILGLLYLLYQHRCWRKRSQPKLRRVK